MWHTGRELAPVGEICRNVCRPQEMERNNSPQQRRRRLRFDQQATAGWAIAAQQQIKCGEFRHPTKMRRKTHFWFQEDRSGSKKQREREEDIHALGGLAATCAHPADNSEYELAGGYTGVYGDGCPVGVERN